MTHFQPTDQINGGAMAPPAPPLATPLGLCIWIAENLLHVKMKCRPII